ncbi:DUF4198 domain-containing protein [Pseudomonas huanghezhanensis]|uniref:DUF4198 domain-containing protein n=1 Tax=Pseudomonas huanghezhanensis TaxID=3002903 RepID=UPI00228625CB|nr:DUF4198 domain-containing protein [Pseudomonas sp. BSw22131]
MNKITTTALLGYGALLLASTAQAHQIWFEQTAQQPLALYYGEYDQNMLEVTPGGLDRFKGLAGWSGQASQPLSLTLKRDYFAVAHQPSPQDTLLAADAQYPIFDLHDEGKTLKVYWTPATRWVGDLRAREPQHDLDIVPTGDAKDGKATFQVFYLRKPLPAQKVVLETASGEAFTQTADQDGKVTFDLPWQGIYVVAAEHNDFTPGERTNTQQHVEKYDVKSFSSTLSFSQSAGKAALPRPASQLPASEVARLKKTAG